MIYADTNGSSQVHPEVKKYLIDRIENGLFANPNSIHCLGRKINLSIEKCRKLCGEVLGANPNQIIFNSGSSEGISHVFHSILCNSKKKHIIISTIEHSAVHNAALFYEGRGFNLHFVDVDENGVIKLDELQKLLKQYGNEVALVSIMAANNETGVIQPYNEIGKHCHEYGVPYFSDTTQFIGKADFNFNESEIDLAVASSHKVGGLIGSGMILSKDLTLLKNHIFGGGQEKGKRGGTQNYIGIECMAVALNAFNENKSNLKECNERRIQFEKRIKENYPNVVIVGEKAPRLSSTTLIAYPGIHGQAVQIELESQDIFVTTSSACSDNEPTTSRVLKAQGIKDDVGRGVVRISLCLGQSPEEYEKIYESLTQAYNKLSKVKYAN